MKTLPGQEEQPLRAYCERHLPVRLLVDSLAGFQLTSRTERHARCEIPYAGIS